MTGPGLTGFSPTERRRLRRLARSAPSPHGALVQLGRLVEAGGHGPLAELTPRELRGSAPTPRRQRLPERHPDQRWGFVGGDLRPRNPNRVEAVRPACRGLRQLGPRGGPGTVPCKAETPQTAGVPAHRRPGPRLAGLGGRHHGRTDRPCGLRAGSGLPVLPRDPRTAARPPAGPGHLARQPLRHSRHGQARRKGAQLQLGYRPHLSLRDR